MRRAHIKYFAYICDQKNMHCAGAKGCGKSCFHTICEECAVNKDSVKLAKDFFDTFNLTVIVKPTAEKQEDLFEVWLEEKRRATKLFLPFPVYMDVPSNMAHEPQDVVATFDFKKEEKKDADAWEVYEEEEES